MPGLSTTKPPTPPAGALYGAPLVVALGTVVLGVAFSRRTLDPVSYAALTASVLLCGLPHGAADWWVMRLAAGPRWTLAGRVRGAALYLGAALLTLAFWRWRPALALPGFFALTAWHFGTAEASALLPERPTFRDPVWWLFAVGRGLLVVFTPLAFRPGDVMFTLVPFILVDASTGEAILTLFRVALPLVWIGAILQTVAIRLDARAHPGAEGRRRLAYNLLETCVLLMLFRVAPPLLAFVCYWVAFHAWRHILRLEALLRPGGGRRPWWRTLADFHARTLALTLLSLPGLWLIFLMWPALRQGVGAVVAYFILLSALTVPHALVIGWLDRARMKTEG